MSTADQLAQARTAVERHLGRFPGDAEKWLELASIRRTQGDLAGALEAAERALGLAKSVTAGLAVAQLMLLSNRVADARALLVDVDGRHSNSAPVKAWLGIALMREGANEQAAVALRESLALDPHNVDALANLASLLIAQDGVQEALAVLKQLHAVDPRSVNGWLLLARARLVLGDAAGAEKCLRAAESLSPELPPHACFQMAGVLQERKAFDDAERYYRRAMALEPDNVLYRSNYADMLCSIGRLNDGLHEHAALLERSPDKLRSHLALNLTLPGVYENSDDLARRRAGFAEGIALLQGRLGRFRALPSAQVEADARWSNYLLAYQGEDDRDLQERFAAFQAEVLAPHAPARTPAAPRRGGRKLRVGFASSFFYHCTVGWYFSSWVTDLDREMFDVYVYSLGPVRDELTIRLADSSAFRPAHHLPLFGIARQMLSDDLDILIFPELGLCPITFALAAMRLAPLQCAGWGHPVTSGHATIDVYFSSELMEPPGAQAHYSERLALLPGLGTAYRRPDVPGDRDRAALGLPDNVPLALISQSLFKIHPDNDALIRRVLEANPRGRLVMFEDSFAVNTSRFKRRLAASGVDLARVVFLRYVPRRDFLAVNAACDVMLDTLHWSGGNTSLDAIAAGLPIVTLPGRFMRGRQSMAMLHAVDCADWIAADASDYVEKATRALGDGDFRCEARERLRAGSTGLYGQGDAIDRLQQTLSALADELR